jgi:putative transposase
VVGPAAKRLAVKDLVKRGKCSERKACTLVVAARSTVRYARRMASDEPALRRRIRGLASKHKRYGCRRIVVMLRREGWWVNKKRIHRLWKEEGLQRTRKRKRKRACGPSPDQPTKAEYPNHVWSYDFIEDRTERGGKLRMLCVLDECTRECHHIRVDRSIGAAKVIASLGWLFVLHGAPEYLRSDNGPELIAKSLRAWLEERGAKTIYITPGSPWENPYIESFNDKFRDECLNLHVFSDGRHAQELVETWRSEYNELRPHSSLNYMPPAEFAAHCRNSSRPTASFRSGNAATPGQTHEPKANTLTLVGT